MNAEKINFEEIDWSEVEYMKCDCCEKFKKCINTNCNWVFIEDEHAICSFKVNVCTGCISSREWWCKKHTWNYIKALSECRAGHDYKQRHCDWCETRYITR